MHVVQTTKFVCPVIECNAVQLHCQSILIYLSVDNECANQSHQPGEFSPVPHVWCERAKMLHCTLPHAALVLNPLSTNQYTSSWTHYTVTLLGTWTDHMVECF